MCGVWCSVCGAVCGVFVWGGVVRCAVCSFGVFGVVWSGVRCVRSVCLVCLSVCGVFAWCGVCVVQCVRCGPM